MEENQNSQSFQGDNSNDFSGQIPKVENESVSDPPHVQPDIQEEVNQPKPMEVHKHPHHVLHKKKWGFRVPLNDWFRGPLRSMLFDYLSRPSGICGTYSDRRNVNALLNAHDSGTTDANLTLWTLLTAEVWYQDVYRARSTPTSLSAVG